MNKPIFIIISLFLIVGVFIYISFRRSHRRPNHVEHPKPRGIPPHEMKKIDANRDGKITIKEWDNHHKEIFARLDKNEDGVLDKDEVKNNSRRP